MTRADYFDFIEGRLSWLVTRLELRGGLNLLNLHGHSEDFYACFLNVLFGWKLKNINMVQPNAAGIDLVDDVARLVVQVSATPSKQKVESALAKDLAVYRGYGFKFICIAKTNPTLRQQTFANPHGLLFSPNEDIHDCGSLLRFIKALPPAEMAKVYDFLKRELKIEPDTAKLESNLATIINIICKEQWDQGAQAFEIIPFEIDAKITRNGLDATKAMIDEYKVHYHRLAKIYATYDQQGVNKSNSVLQGIRAEYHKASAQHSAPDQTFLATIANVAARIRTSANYAVIPDEELELGVELIVVDAFIRCKIFKHPLLPANAPA